MDAFNILAKIRKNPEIPQEIVPLLDKLAEEMSHDPKVLISSFVVAADDKDIDRCTRYGAVLALHLSQEKDQVVVRGAEGVAAQGEKGLYQAAKRNAITLSGMIGENPRFCGGRKRRCDNCDDLYFSAQEEKWWCKACGAGRTLCRRMRMDNGRCAFHGGKVISGPAHHNYKDGRHTKALKKLSLRQAYVEALQDREWLSMRESIALVDAYIAEQLGMIGDTETAVSAAEELAQAIKELRKAQIKGVDDDVLHAAKRVIFMHDAVNNENALWGNVFGALDSRMRMVDAERRMIVDSKKVITVPQFMAFIDKLTIGIKKAVSREADENTKKRVMAHYSMILRSLTGKGELPHMDDEPANKVIIDG